MYYSILAAHHLYRLAIKQGMLSFIMLSKAVRYYALSKLSTTFLSTYCQFQRIHVTPSTSLQYANMLNG